MEINKDLLQYVAIEFAKYICDNMWQNMYYDIDNDGKTWVACVSDIAYQYDMAHRVTIEEIYGRFLDDKLSKLC
jgi:hypothetical protein